jgi:hypothetical protein
LPVLLPGIYFLRRYIVNPKLKYLPFLSYWWAVGFAVLLALSMGSIVGNMAKAQFRAMGGKDSMAMQASL